jgi:hypothetical protein
MDLSKNVLQSVEQTRTRPEEKDEIGRRHLKPIYIWFGPTVGDTTGFLRLQLPLGLSPRRCVDHEPSSAGPGDVGGGSFCLFRFIQCILWDVGATATS